MNSIHFPEKVIVTDQLVDCTKLSNAKKTFVTEFASGILDEFLRSGAKRKIYGIAGPSGSGKTFLSVLAKEIGRTINPDVDIVPLSIDAYHFKNEYLTSTPNDGKSLKDVKGRFDTYDVASLILCLEEFRHGGVVHLPEYSRKLHDPIENVVRVGERPTLLLLEGLWLLYEEAGWGNVNLLLDKTFYVDDVAEESKAHTLLRHMLGGRSNEEANRYYEESDVKNRELVTKTKGLADVILVWPK